MSPCATRRRRARLFCRGRATPQTSADVHGVPAPPWHRPSSGRPCTVEVGENPREVCVARWYDPGTGQFMSVDPDLAETGQPYAFAGDDPVNESDPSGLHLYNPCNWFGICHKIHTAVDALTIDSVLSLIRSTVSARLAGAVSSAETAAQSLQQDAAAITSTTCITAETQQLTELRWPDWFSYEWSGTWLLELAEVFPPAAFFSSGVTVTVDRYGDAFIGPQVGVSGPGFQISLDGGWILNANVPSKEETKSFISSWSLVGSFYAPPFGFSVLYGNVLSWGFHAFGVQIDAGAITGKGFSASASYDIYLGNTGLSW